MATVDRIRTQRQCTAMAAMDTMDLLAERVQNLLKWGRRISVARRYTYTGNAPDLTVGLTIDTNARNGGIHYRRAADQANFGVLLKPGIHGFGFSAFAGINDTEKNEWARYHAADDSDVFKRRRDMTVIHINGGMTGDEGPARDDSLVIEAWNQHGVCDEYVIGFDTDAYWAEQGER